MSEIKEKKNPGLMIAALVLLLLSVGLFCTSTALNKFGFVSLVDCVVETAINILAFVYIINDFAKKYEKHFRLYFAISAVSFVLENLIITFDNGSGSTLFELGLNFILDMIVYGNCMLLAFGKELGKKASLCLVWISFATYLICALTYLISSLISEDGAVFYLSIEYFGILCSCALSILLIYGKYEDKAVRGSK